MGDAVRWSDSRYSFGYRDWAEERKNHAVSYWSLDRQQCSSWRWSETPAESAVPRGLRRWHSCELARSTGNQLAVGCLGLALGA